jgi:hypothetical protein
LGLTDKLFEALEVEVAERILAYALRRERRYDVVAVEADVWAGVVRYREFPYSATASEPY